jgi:hypothetical protein
MSCYITFGGYRNRKRLTRSVIEWFIHNKWKQQWKKDKVENKWHSKIVPDTTKYDDEPWEIEAHALEKELYTRYVTRS